RQGGRSRRRRRAQAGLGRFRPGRRARPAADRRADDRVRIVSLLPSATEIVCAIGLESELVGVTHECDWPPSVLGKAVVTRDTQDLLRAPARTIHDRVTAAMHGGSSLYALDAEALAAAEP